MNKNFKNAAQAGFTLIELIVVIVILGILAATALPKFANMSSDARLAAVQGLKGSVSTAANMVHAQALLKNQTDATGTVTMEGATINLVYGYPAAASIVAAGNIDGVQVFDTKGATDTFPAVTTASQRLFLPNGVASDSTTAAKCYVKYSEATASTPPVVETGATKADDCK